MIRFLVIAGISGTGKTMLRDKLEKDYSDLFYVCPQATTRALRKDESIYNYIFLKDKDTYDLLEDRLVGKTIINGNYYGSLFNEMNSKIGIVILNEAGLKDLIKFKENAKDKDIRILSIGIDKNIEELSVMREGRDEEFLKKERAVLDLCNIVIKLNGENEWVNPEQVKDLAKKYLGGIK